MLIKNTVKSDEGRLAPCSQIFKAVFNGYNIGSAGFNLYCLCKTAVSDSGFLVAVIGLNSKAFLFGMGYNFAELCAELPTIKVAA